MNSVSTAKETARAISAISPRSLPTTTTARAKIPASSAIGNERSTSVTEYCRSRGASGAYATTTPCPSRSCRGASGWTTSTNVRPLSSPVVTSTVAFLHCPVCSLTASRPDGVEVSPVGGTCEALTSAQSTDTTFVTRPSWVCRSKPTPVRSWAGAPPGQNATRPTRTAVAKGISTAAMTLRRCFDTGAAGPWLWVWPCAWLCVLADAGPWGSGAVPGDVTRRSSQERGRPSGQHARTGVSVEPHLYTRELGAPG